MTEQKEDNDTKEEDTDNLVFHGDSKVYKIWEHPIGVEFNLQQKRTFKARFATWLFNKIFSPVVKIDMKWIDEPNE